MKGLLEDVMPVERWPYRKNGKVEYIGCRTCAQLMDDGSTYDDRGEERRSAGSDS